MSGKPSAREPISEIKPFSLSFPRELDGGGSKLFPAYLEIVRELPRPRRIFEWCSGPGFIGFSMLANGLCDSLCLADINPAAVDCCRRTVADNGLSDRVSVYHSDNLRDIPSDERWDLVVSNPPHFDTTTQIMPQFPDLLYMDPGWHLHRAFYGNIERFLAPGGMVLLLENFQGSSPSVFQGMITDAGLEIVYCRPMPGYLFYFLGSIRRSEIGSWAARFPKPGA